MSKYIKYKHLIISLTSIVFFFISPVKTMNLEISNNQIKTRPRSQALFHTQSSIIITETNIRTLNNNRDTLVPIEKSFCEKLCEKCCFFLSSKKKNYVDAVIKISEKNGVISHSQAINVLSTIRKIAQLSQQFLRTLALLAHDATTGLPPELMEGFLAALLKENIDITGWINSDGFLADSPRVISKIVLRWVNDTVTVLSTHEMNDELITGLPQVN